VKRLGDQTLYEILEVPFDAAPSAIEAAIERAHALFGPGSLVAYTLMTPEDASLLMRRIEEAKRTLLDPEARNRYDDALTAPPPAPGSTNGVTAPPFAAAPPVVPALPEPEPQPEPQRAPEPEPRPDAREPSAERRLDAPDAARAEDVAEAVPVDSPAPTLPTPPAPIRLEREIAPASPPPSAAPPATAVEIPLPEGALWTGEALRKVREARGITIGQIAERTKVTRHHVENIEGERFAALPAPVYLRGILLAMARELRLDGQKVARAYLERAGSAARDAKAR
jgi:Helix-turn-helix domain